MHDQIYHLHKGHSVCVNFGDRARLKLVDEANNEILMPNIFKIFSMHRKLKDRVSGLDYISDFFHKYLETYLHNMTPLFSFS